MKFIITKWSIKKLYDTFKKGQLNLTPVYQRNFIWSIKDQQYLIQSLQKKNAIPNFFFLQKDKKKLEIVDGQQRSRTIISFIDKQFKDIKGRNFDGDQDFLSYEFPVTIITDLEGESIERFYAIVNRTGIHLNKPEVRTAEFYDTNYLKLVNDIVKSPQFKNLGIFSDASLKRMNDIEYVAELVVLIKDGHVDKKDNMDDYFKSDLSTEDCTSIKSKLNDVLTKINLFNKIFPISDTRYKQKNDFYTLVDFLSTHTELSISTLQYFYKILVLIGKDIRPTQENCEPFKEYALNCVTQSNSKTSRANRLKFFNELFINNGEKLNPEQLKINSFYGLKSNDFIKKEDNISLSVEKLSIAKPSITFES
jgi:hypothetical protein